MVLNYSKICQDLLKDLPERQKEVILRRFALLSTGERIKRETLEAIGKSYSITRERVRQIEEAGFVQLKPKIKQCQKIFQYFIKELKKAGGFKKEDILLSQLGGKNQQPQVFFLLTIGKPFKRFSETKEIYPFWTINANSLDLIQKNIGFLNNKLEESGKPLSLKELSSFSGLRDRVLSSYLEISKIILKNQQGLFGLRSWPEINPKGVRDKAYLVFKKENQPLHFTRVADLIGPGTLVQTVHNELIRDPRFVLVGRGLYALKDWGYQPGRVEEVIFRVLKEAGRPLSKQEVLENVLKQRLIKENTILLNLNNKKYFFKTPEGKYTIQEA